MLAGSSARRRPVSRSVCPARGLADDSDVLIREERGSSLPARWSQVICSGTPHWVSNMDSVGPWAPLRMPIAAEMTDHHYALMATLDWRSYHYRSPVGPLASGEWSFYEAKAKLACLQKLSTPPLL